MSDLLKPFGIMPRFAHAHDPDRPVLSKRQLAEQLGREPDITSTADIMIKAKTLTQFDFVFSAKFAPRFRQFLRTASWEDFQRRPCFISAFPGLEFLPDTGIEMRSVADILCFNSVADTEAFRQRFPKSGKASLKFNPMLYTTRAMPPQPPQVVRTLVFFTQSALPNSRDGRTKVASLLKRIGNKNPACRILVKLRQLPGENRFHTHREYTPYPPLLRSAAPGRIEFVDTSMSNLLQQADAVLTCSSTAGLEAMCAGVPAMYLTNYPGCEAEAQWQGIRRCFAGSGLDVSMDQALALEVPRANQEWWTNNTSGPQELASLVRHMTAQFDVAQKACAH